MMQWKYIVLVICLLSASFLFWKELRRDNKARLFWRLLASAVAVSSLYFLAVPLKTRSARTGHKEEAVILTNGFSKDSLNAFLQQKKTIPVYPVREYLAGNHPAGKLFVFGDGLLKEEWQQLSASSVEFHPSPVPFGIIDAHWNKNVTNGSPLVIQGTFNNNSSQTVRIALEGFGKVLDTVELSPQKRATFELKTVPLQRGKAVLALRFVNGKDTVREPVPFEVIGSGRLRVLVLASAPGFENRFLTNWLIDNGYTAVTRTTISKNKFQQSFLDTNKINLNSITSSLLNGFDILLADGTALENLTSSELNAVKQHVAENGMGLIIQADTLTNKDAFYKTAFSFAASNNHNKQSVILRGPDMEFLPALSIEQPLHLKPVANVQTLISDKDNNIFSAASLYGEGKILFSTVPGTYNWMLSGNASDYARYWSVLLENAVGRKTETISYNINGLPLVNEPVNIRAFSEDQPQPRSAGQFIAWRQDPVALFKWDGNYWPLKAGWQNVDGFKWYAYDSADWKNVQRQRRMNESYEYLSSFKEQSITPENNEEERDAIPALFIWSLFVVCCIFLWIEGKLF
ncbi:hypothetical protein QTN47_25105 [Danxiaibacter flavus]|uniref:Uncharacterized protein n=1 Tax=Danxiaibacter flavus TaxID=3049108 RepID=A0ABV3ZNU7_9BACT|nr:hypothetical protein QNM32_25110 [Chitinophagaceae bacterium DXS]